MRFSRLRARLVAVGNRMHECGLVQGTAGNMSARDPRSGRVVIKPSGVPYGELRPENLVVLDPEGAVLEGRLRPSTEFRMHLRIYRDIAGAMGIVHTHSPAATAFAVAKQPLRTALAESAAVFESEVPLARYATSGTARLGQFAVEAMRHAPAALLANHGVVAIGTTVEEAFVHALLVEEAARIQWMAHALGGPVPLSRAECRRIRRGYLAAYGQVAR